MTSASGAAAATLAAASRPTRTRAGSTGAARASRSAAVTSGMRTYIIAMPEANQTANSAPPAMPSQRCRRIRTVTVRSRPMAPGRAVACVPVSVAGAIANWATAARIVAPEHLPWMGDTSAILPQGWSPPNRRAASGRMCNPHSPWRPCNGSPTSSTTRQRSPASCWSGCPTPSAGAPIRSRSRPAISPAHIVECVGWARTILTAVEFDVDPATYRPFAATSQEALLDGLDRAADAGRAAFAAVNEAALMSPGGC